MTRDTAKEIIRRWRDRQSSRAIAFAVHLSHTAVLHLVRDPRNYPIEPWRCPTCNHVITTVDCLFCELKPTPSNGGN